MAANGSKDNKDCQGGIRVAPIASTKKSKLLLRKPRVPSNAIRSTVENALPPSPPVESPVFGNDTHPSTSPYPSLHPSLVSPPPPSTIYSQTKHSRAEMQSAYSRLASSIYHKGDLKYVLDPGIRSRTQLGTYVEGETLLKPFKHRGPDGLPNRGALRAQRMPPRITFPDDPNETTKEEPIFTLQDFMRRVSDLHKVPLIKVKQTVCSRKNYKQVQQMLSRVLHQEQRYVARINLKPSDSMPNVEPRIPQKQLLLEMAALVKEQMSREMQVEMKTIIRPLPKYSPNYKPGSTNPHTEILVYENTEQIQKERLKQRKREAEVPNSDSIVRTPSAKVFAGAPRSRSPFVQADEEISAPEIAMLDSMMSGGYALSLKAMFISQLPDLEPISQTLTYINLSFNNFQWVPHELFDLDQLTVLKMRNNPVYNVSPEISKLRNLHTLVLSYCMISNLPSTLFQIESLVHLDVAYNKLTFLSNDIKYLRNLREFNIEGNQLIAMPMGALKLHELQLLNVRNNFMHPLLWQENSQNQPQRLFDIAALCVRTHPETLSALNEVAEGILNYLSRPKHCECCNGPLFGPGLRIIRPVSKIYSIKNLPFIFHSCSPSCRKEFMNSTESLTQMLYGPN